MSTPTMAQDRATRRAKVRQLAQEGMSHRAIAARLGVSKDTVRRDLAHQDAHADAPPVPEDIVLPHANPLAVRAVAALRNLDPKALRQDARQVRQTTPYLHSVIRFAADALTHTGPGSAVERWQLRQLADRLRAIADQEG